MHSRVLPVSSEEELERLRTEVESLRASAAVQEEHLLAVTREMDAMLLDVEKQRNELAGALSKASSMSALLDRIYETVEDLVVFAGRNGRIQRVNHLDRLPAVLQAALASGPLLDTLVLDEDLREMADELPPGAPERRGIVFELACAHARYRREVRLKLDDEGECRTWLLRTVVSVSPQGKIDGVVAIFTDISEQKRNAEKIVHQHQVLRTIIDRMPGGISLFDGDFRIVAYNEQFKVLLDFPDSLLAGGNTTFQDLARFNAMRGEYGPGDVEEKVAAVMSVLKSIEVHKFERVRPDGRVLEVMGAPIPDGGFVSIYMDITERKRAEERIRSLALKDALTGLPNRLNLNEQVEQAVFRAMETGSRFALLFLDLDGFKKVNDTLGHDAGDELLVQVARRLCETVRETDTVARLGGDEFIVLLRDIGSVGVPQRIADAIVRCLTAPFALSQTEARVGTSIGIAIYPEHGADREGLLKASDAAMYAAKNAGRGTWRMAETITAPAETFSAETMLVRIGGHREIARMLIHTTIGEIDGDLTALGEAVSVGNWLEVRRLLAAMISLSAQLGGMELLRQLQLIESGLGERGRVDGSQIDALWREHSALTESLEVWLGEVVG